MSDSKILCQYILKDEKRIKTEANPLYVPWTRK